MHRKKAFTLIEVLVVVAIIGIIASMVIVNIRDARITAQNAGAKSDITQIGKVIETYKIVEGGGSGILYAEPYRINNDPFAATSLFWGPVFNTQTSTFEPGWRASGGWTMLFGGNPPPQSWKYKGSAVSKTVSRAHRYDYATNRLSLTQPIGGYGCAPDAPCVPYYCLVTNQVPTIKEPVVSAFAIKNGKSVDLANATPTTWYFVYDSEPNGQNICD